jgi:uncharacterized protein
MELTPVLPSGRQVIEGYGASGFRVAGIHYAGSILVFPDATFEWPVSRFEDVALDALQPVVERGGTEILLLGCGARMQRVPAALRQALKGASASMPWTPAPLAGPTTCCWPRIAGWRPPCCGRAEKKAGPRPAFRQSRGAFPYPVIAK